jgi:hypothetical protein
MSVLCSCGIYPSCVKSKYQKDEWCKFIHHQINNLFSIGKFRIRIDKLMEQHNYIYDNKEKVIDKWFKVILCFVSFKRYRAELEGKNKKTDTRLKVLKNTVIKIGKNL